MSRWHKSSCKEPDVKVDGNLPRCIACDSFLNLQEILSKQDGSSTFQPLPQDEPFGQMNLWWPSSVPYVNSEFVEESSTSVKSSTEDQPRTEVEEDQQPAQTDDGNSKYIHDFINSIQPPAEAQLGYELRAEPQLERKGTRVRKSMELRPKDDASSIHSAISPIYEETLASNQFRLACITAVDDINSPIHLTLETYTDDNCPEYETVSYTWGGEDGDSSLRCPIFIGPYWDVLLQTKNCWEMLRFVRPKRGIRLLWIDTLCINQKNMKERADQVGKMVQIYAECSRVIVYLGADIIYSQQDRFPLRHRLHELEGNLVRPQLPVEQELQHLNLDLKSVLQRRYFSRVWVIQELTLPPRAVIRIGDVDFWADALMSQHLANAVPPDWRWEATSAPWLQHMARRNFPVKDICEVLGLTSNSQSTDPRDKVFGVLGLVPTSAQQYQLRPDYSLSSQHIFIGLFAHCLINQKTVWFLSNASGISESESIPTWVPNWKSEASWKKFTMPEYENDTMASYIQQSFTRSGMPFVRYMSNYFNARPDSGYLIPEYEDENSWYHDIKVDYATGALLSVNLTRFSQIPSQPVLLQKLGTFGIYVIRSPIISLYLVSRAPLDELVKPGLDHLFILSPRTSDLMFLILRDVKHEAYEEPTTPITPGHNFSRRLSVPKGQTFKLVASCPYFFTAWYEAQFNGDMSPTARKFSIQPEGNQGFGGYSVQMIEQMNRPQTLYSHVDSVRSRLEEEFYFIDRTKEIWARETDLGITMRQIFPSSKQHWDVLPIYLALAKEKEGSGSRLEAPYLRCIDPKFQPRLRDEFLELSFDPEDWAKVELDYSPSRHLRKPLETKEWESFFDNLSWQWEHKANEWKSTKDKQPKSTAKFGGGARPVHLRASIDKIWQYIRSHEQFQNMSQSLISLKRLIGKDAELHDVEDRLKNPRPEDRAIMIEGELGSLTIDGGIYQVDIL